MCFWPHLMLMDVSSVNTELTANHERRLWSLLGFDQAFLHQTAVELLDVCVDTLPVGLFHPD